MNAVWGILRDLKDSPTYGRDRATLLSGGTIGLAGLLLNFAVLALVLPLMLAADEAEVRIFSENLEFGQLLALILLGGAAAFATLLIPLRLVTVFWGPRINRYFDQIVLSGISPLRFVIGKAASQNLFLGLILFLLLPYLVLSLTLGGVDLVTFAAGLLLVWLYCIALALVTLWVSLYLNELLAAVQVMIWAVVLSIFGCLPIPFQPFVVTPFPALMQPVYAALPNMWGWSTAGYWPMFVRCALAMTAVIGIAAFAIQLGPLFGIIRENSTFGEVVREGDSRRKRWSRLRQHIQRPSELAFFYENRSSAFRRREGLLRWGLAFGGLLLAAGAAYIGLVAMASLAAPRQPGRWHWFVHGFHASCLTIHGALVVAAVLLFSHARSSIFLRVRIAFGRSAEVARLDTVAFVLFLLLTTAASLAAPYYFDHYHAAPLNESIFADGQGRIVNWVRLAAESTLVISVAGVVVYAFQRLACLGAWLKFPAFLGVGFLYFILVCLVPLLVYGVINDIPELRAIDPLRGAAAQFAIVSPWVALMYLLDEMGRSFPEGVSTVPFYAAHALLLILVAFSIRRGSPKLRALYLDAPLPETAP